MILADTSAWVEYDRATGSPVDRRMTDLISTDGPLAVTDPVVMEVLAGARTDQREADLRRLLLRFDLLRFDLIADFHAAARVYRTCRRAGITPRGLTDCMRAPWPSAIEPSSSPTTPTCTVSPRSSGW